MNAQGKKIGLAALMSGAALGLASVASAQQVDFSPCGAVAANACVQQIDSRTTVAPSRNVSGSIIRGDSNTVEMNQTGGRGLALVGVAGNGNTVTTSQSDARNRAVVGIAGNKNAVTVQQSENGNRAAVAIVGNSNGLGKGNTGLIQGRSPIALNVLYRANPLDFDFDNDKVGFQEDTNDAKKAKNGKDGATGTGRSLGMPSDIPSGLIRQSGSNNTAAVVIAGNNNDFNVTQLNGNNSAEQSILGNNNAMVALQNGGSTSTQSQIGSNNLSYVVQQGSGNYAKTFQNSANSEILLAQTGSNNSADLNQFGANNSIALSQTGNVSAVISQFGNRSIAVEQQAGITGSSPLVINQF